MCCRGITSELAGRSEAPVELRQASQGHGARVPEPTKLTPIYTQFDGQSAYGRYSKHSLSLFDGSIALGRADEHSWASCKVALVVSQARRARW